MKKIILSVFIYGLLVTLFGSTQTIAAEPPSVAPPSSDVARIIFLRSRKAYRNLVAVFTVKGPDIQYHGVTKGRVQQVLDLPPGKHTIMVLGETTDYMTADIEGGKTYYAIIRARMGGWKPRFSVFPVKRSGGYYDHNHKYVKSLQRNKFHTMEHPNKKWWSEKRKIAVLKKHQVWWPKWQTKPAAHRAKFALSPEDGI